MIARSFGSDNNEVAGLPGAVTFFSFKFDTETGSKSKKTSLITSMQNVKSAMLIVFLTPCVAHFVKRLRQ